MSDSCIKIGIIVPIIILLVLFTVEMDVSRLIPESLRQNTAPIVQVENKTKESNSTIIAQPQKKVPSNWCDQVLWVHPPKTGSTFCLSIQHACCKTPFELFADQINTKKQNRANNSTTSTSLPSVDLAWGCVRFLFPPSHPCKFSASRGHDPLQLKETSSRGVMIIREPKSRIVSSFLDGRHVEGLSEREKPYVIATANGTEGDLDRQIWTYATHWAMLGCQTKMLIGMQCYAPYNLTQEHVTAAVNKLHSLFFVGIFDRYADSVAQFHRLVNVSTKPHPIELTNFRSYWRVVPGDPSLWSEEDAGLNVTLSEHLRVAATALKEYRDPFDEVIYKEAVDIFERRQRDIGRT